MDKRELGKSGLSVSAMGLGCMAMSEFYGNRDERVSEQVIRRALDLGVRFLDTADTYGNGHNETLVGRMVRTWQKETGKRAVIASKFGIVRKPGSYEREICGRPDYVRTAAEASLKRLGLESLDLYYVHRIDTSIPIEETMGALSNLVQEGKIRYIGLSECSVETLDRAHKVHPITCVQSEYSLFTREPEDELMPFLKENGIGFVPYSPLGRGMLTGKLTQKGISENGDMRQFLPRTSKENFDTNAALVACLAEMGQQRHLSAAVMALAWVLGKGREIVPIPGTRTIRWLEENISATQVVLTEEENTAIENIFEKGAVFGERYTAEGMKGVNA